MSLRKNEILAYLAGIVDGEGYIGIKKTRAYKCQDRQTPGYHACIAVKMINEKAIHLLATNLGGWYYKEKRSPPQRRQLFCYHVTDKRAEQTLRSLLPYLRVKRQNAKCVLQLRKLQTEGRKHQTRITGHRKFPDRFGVVRIIENHSFSDEYVAQCEVLYQRAKQLNHC